MGKYLPVQLDEADPFYVKSFGLEEDAALAHWSGRGKRYCILHFVISGEGEFCGHTVREEQGFFISCGAEYEYHSSDAHPWNYFWVIFSEELAKKYVGRLLCPDENGVFSYSFRLPLLELCSRLFTNKTLSHEKALSVFFELLSFCRETDCENSAKPRAHVARAKLYIERNLHKRLPVSAVAEAIHIDERYMYNLFRRYEHISPKEYILKRKTELACGILSDTGLSVSEAARMTGFGEVCDFSNFFSKRTGFSPTAYRSRLRKGDEV